MKNLLSIHDISVYQFHTIMDLAREIKKNPKKFRLYMQNRILAHIFKKSGFHTRIGFEAGWLQMGGKTIHIPFDEIPKDMLKSKLNIGKYLEKCVDGIFAEELKQKLITDLATTCTIPIVNGKSDLLNPCQALGEIFTFNEKKGDLTHSKLAYLDSDRSQCHSLLFACAKLGMEINVLVSESFKPDTNILNKAKKDGVESEFNAVLTNDPFQAAKDADFLYLPEEFSDQQKSKQKYKSSLYQKEDSIITLAKSDALIIRRFPWQQVYKNTDELIDSAGSIMLEVADNKFHVQKAIMILLLDE